MREKRHFLLSAEYQLTAIRRNDRNRKSHLANTTITDADKNHQWRLKFVGKSMMRNGISA